MKKPTLALAALLLAGPLQAQVARTYIASVGAQATTAAILLSIEAPSGEGFRLAGYCVGSSAATAAAAVTVTVRRTTTASSAGTALTAEGTGTTAVSKLFPTDINFAGVARLNGTPGTAGATLDQWGFNAPVLTASGPMVQCVYYNTDPRVAMPAVAAGTANGLSINVSAPGAGGLASGSISAVIVMGTGP